MEREEKKKGRDMSPMERITVHMMPNVGGFSRRVDAVADARGFDEPDWAGNGTDAIFDKGTLLPRVVYAAAAIDVEVGCDGEKWR